MGNTFLSSMAAPLFPYRPARSYSGLPGTLGCLLICMPCSYTDVPDNNLAGFRGCYGRSQQTLVGHPARAAAAAAKSPECAGPARAQCAYVCGQTTHAHNDLLCLLRLHSCKARGQYEKDGIEEVPSPFISGLCCTFAI
eukprot:1160596-Pelagomonas_calceolata.AAC.2